MTGAVSSKAKGATVRLARIALFVALIVAGAFIKVPIGIMPVSLQCSCCILCALLLGPWDSLACVAIYLTMGLVGIPVFTAGGGFAYVLQPTFGYLIAYIFAMPIGGMIARGIRLEKRPTFLRMLLGAVAALAIVYTVGVMYMYLLLNYYTGSAIALSKAWLTGAAVFLPTDGALCVICALIASKTAPIICKRNFAVKGLPKEAAEAEYYRE